MSKSRSIRLSVIGQDRDEVSFYDGSHEGLRIWVTKLQAMIDSGADAGERLLTGLTEMNRCRMPNATRFEQLEMLRPFVRSICNRISATGLQQPLSLSADSRRMLGRAQMMQYQLASGYKIVLAGLLRDRVKPVDPAAGESPGAMATVSLHRAIEELAQTLLRALQLYTPAPGRLWEQLHQLFVLAEHRGALGYRVHDATRTLDPVSSLLHAYLRTLLIGSARPNMLRPQVLGVLFTALEDWAGEAVLARPEEVPDHNLLLDLGADRGPVEAVRYVHHTGENLRCLDTTHLRDRLKAYLDGHVKIKNRELAAVVDELLLGHVVEAWGSGARRHFNRTASDAKIELCIGMRAIHYHSAGGVSLERQLRGYQAFGSAHDLDEAEFGVPPGEDDARSYPVSRVDVVDVSPRGYRLSWQGAVHRELETGELVGLRESDSGSWSIGAVRWCRNEPEAVQFGVEMLAPQALTACVRPISNDPGKRKWGAALVLPELRALDQPAHLITRTGRFAAGQKVALSQFGIETRARLDALERRTRSFDNFVYDELGSRTPPVETGIEVEYLEF